MKMKYLMLLPVVAMLGACSSNKVVTADKLEGTWNIVEVNGQKIADGDPYIGFDAVAGRVYGSFGCNRIVGGFDPKCKAGTLALDKLGSTQMMCADMTTENLVSKGLSGVKGFALDKDAVTLTDGNNKAIVVLKRRCKEVRAEELDGEWAVKSIRGEALPGSLSKKPFVAFDAEKNLVSGNDGCNSFNGGYKADGLFLTFSSIAATLMACPDVEIEGQVLDALSNTAKFGRIPDGNIGLFDNSDNLLLELEKL